MENPKKSIYLQYIYLSLSLFITHLMVWKDEYNIVIFLFLCDILIGIAQCCIYI